ncbi:AAA family ATPase [Paenibacillus sp. NPDC093718]|uniref:AAA family ATPase n=1 Tax=Paenibacillus sp. NPDC093718 TaxID=3390601 RepID=UPI003CFBD1E4
MMCGVAGSGKTTFAQRLEQRGFVRLSIDEEMKKYGLQMVDTELIIQLKCMSNLKLKPS